ncbi:zinc ribbon domain-containing protein [Lactovum miscens]|uniref:Zinc-ribbon domain-containing protein n=1 Tax=Lactovum miscens TaxID=190387 RepID=A0A841C451_9LACT|nr:zinc ribbon domain-containing protein [Lactovum miscens]MBB5887593.1 hypothetical protein [Lactovum miscens]
MSLLSKKRYRYEMLNVQNMNVDAIKNADDLINFIIGENKGLQAQHEEGSATLVKYLNDKAIYAQNIKLPILQNEAYFENLLVNFYTKAAVPFDPSLLEEIQTEQFPRHEVLETYSDPVEPVQTHKTTYNDDFPPAPNFWEKDEEKIEEKEHARFLLDEFANIGRWTPEKEEAPVIPSVSQAFCLFCGEQIEPKSRFCNHCGKLQEAPQEPTEVPEPTPEESLVIKNKEVATAVETPIYEVKSAEALPVSQEISSLPMPEKFAEVDSLVRDVRNLVSLVNNQKTQPLQESPVIKEKQVIEETKVETSLVVSQGPTSQNFMTKSDIELQVSEELESLKRRELGEVEMLLSQNKQKELNTLSEDFKRKQAETNEKFEAISLDKRLEIVKKYTQKIQNEVAARVQYQVEQLDQELKSYREKALMDMKIQ